VARARFEIEMDKIAAFHRGHVGQCDLQTFVDGYSGRMGDRYKQALLDYCSRGLNDSDSHVLAFVKAERVLDYVVDPEAKVVDPRIIHPRKPVFNLLLGSYLSGVEKHMSGMTHNGLRITCKELNLEQRASLVLQHVGSIGDCFVYELDGKRFDGHVNPYSLSREHMVYKEIYRGDGLLSRLLGLQARSKCRLPGGYSYTLTSRCSGDWNTSLGNHTLMIAMVRSSMVRYANEDWSFICDGDNVVILVSKRIKLDIDALVEHFKCLGQLVELTETTIERLEFCRSRIYHGPAGTVFTRNPRRILGGILTVYRYLDKLDSYLHCILLGESHVSAGVPIVQEYVHKCLDLLEARGNVDKSFKPDQSAYDRVYRFAGVSNRHPVVKYSVEQLHSYLDAWEIDIVDYHAVLTLIDSFDLSFIAYKW
jgi:hypothetical protein